MLSGRGKIAVIYDGECRFCIRALEFVRWADSGQRLLFYDYHDQAMLAEKFPMLNSDELSHAMVAVTPNRKVYRGFFAFRRLIVELPKLYPLLLFFYFPGAFAIGPVIYGWIANNRRRFGCNGAFCRVGEGKKSE